MTVGTPGVGRSPCCKKPDTYCFPDAETKVLGGCGGQSFDADAKRVQKWANRTRVEDYKGADLSPDPAGVPPYSRLNQTNDGVACAPFDTACEVTGTPCWEDVAGNDKKKCCPWPIDEKGELNHAADYSHRWTNDKNCYERIPGESVDFTKCRKLGFKNVQARKIWHGRFGFMSVDNGDWGAECGTVADQPQCDCEYKGYQTTSDKVKYLRCEGTASQTGTGALGGEPNPTTTSTASRTAEVDRYSGQVVRTESVGGDDDGVIALALLGIQAYTPSSLWGIYCGKVSSFDTTQLTFNNDEDGNYSATGDYIGGGSEHVVVSISVSVSGGTYDFTSTTEGSGVGTGVTQRSEEHITMSNTTVTWHRELELTPGGGTFTLGVEDAIVTLSEPYTASELVTDLYDLMAEWNMADDTLYPFREDDVLMQGPVVFRDEVPAAVVPTLQGPPDPYVPEANPIDGEVYSGDILGKPNPVGYEPHFDWRHLNWAICEDAEPYPQWDVISFGAASPFPHATKWTEKTGLGLQPQPFGSGAFFHHMPGGACWAQKWCEAIVARPSYNFFGPWGKWRYAVDETKAGCVDSVVGSGELGDEYVVTASFNGGDPGIEDGDTVYYNGKIWILTSQSFPDYTLEAPAIADVPLLAWPFIPGDTFGKVRFPDAWPIGGRVKVISAIQDGPDVDAAIEGPGVSGDATYLRTGDLVDFETGEGVPILASADVTVDDETHFTFTGDSPTRSGLIAATVASGGTGYSIGDVLTVAGGTGAAATVKVILVASGVVSGVVVEDPGLYTVDPPSPNAATGGTGTGISLTLEFELLDVYAKSNGAPSYEWFDTRSKGQFLAFNWLHDFRDYKEADCQCLRFNSDFCDCGTIAEGVTCDESLVNNCGVDPGTWGSTVRPYQEGFPEGFNMPRSVKGLIIQQRCIKQSACAPAVICWSPNYDATDSETIDKFPNGITLPFGHGVTSFGALSDIVDDRYGALWQAAAAQHMWDPLWQRPHFSCEAYETNDFDYSTWCWEEDNYSCALCDGVPFPCGPFGTDKPAWFYPMRPFVEQVQELPAGAPALPDGVSIGFASLEDMQTPTPPTLPSAYPPAIFEDGLTDSSASFPSTPWGIYIRECECVQFRWNNGDINEECRSTNFASEYLRQGISC